MGPHVWVSAHQRDSSRTIITVTLHWHDLWNWDNPSWRTGATNTHIVQYSLAHILCTLTTSEKHSYSLQILRRFTFGFMSPVVPDQVTYLLSFSHVGVCPVAWLEGLQLHSPVKLTQVCQLSRSQRLVMQKIDQQTLPFFSPVSINLYTLSDMCACANVYLGVNCSLEPM